MRKVFVSVIIAVLCLTGSGRAEVEQDTEVHKVIGGLYSLVSAVALNGSTNPHINQLRQYFTNIPADWHNQVQLKRVNDSVWAGVSVGKYSSARRFLRTHAQELGIMESPEGYSWLGGDYAWLKVSGTQLRAARGEGKDSGLVFLSADGGYWWLASPDFTKDAAGEVLRRFGVKDAAGLHRPAGVHESVYESVRPADVKKPDAIHMGRKKSSFDMDIELGRDVIFNPIPNTRRN